MTLSLEGLRAFVNDANVRAILRCVRHSESNNRDDGSAYRTLYGGELVEDISRHPRIAKMSPWGYTSAAGAYQAMCAVPGKVTTDTWGDFCRDMGSNVDEMPFDPDTQDCFAVWCLRRRGALSDAVHGRFESVIAKCSYEWASWPPGRYGQPTTTLDKLRSLYLEYGGRIDNGELLQPAAPIEDRPQPPAQPEPQKEWTMPIPAIVLGLIQAAASVLPVIAQIKGDKSQSAATQNVAIAGKVLDVVATTVGAVNQQQAVEIVQQDPAARQKADEALRAQFFDLLKFAQEQEAISWDRTEKSVSEARSFAERMTSGEGWRAIGYGALLGLLALLIIGGGGVIFAYVLFAPKDLFDGSVRAGIIEIVKAIVILVVGFFFGSSSSSRQSGEALRNIAQGKGTQV